MHILTCIDLERCQIVLRFLHEIENSKLGEDITQRAKDTRACRDATIECWPEFRHAANRLLAYQQAIEFFRRAENSWPKLFKEVEITFLPSSIQWDRPLRNRSSTAEVIVTRMTHKAHQIEFFRDFVKDLQPINLDERIEAERRNKEFRPIVHAEVLLLDDLVKRRSASNNSFFGGWMYIGSSKPTCKLCNYYFEASRLGVRCRPTHANLYLNWRLPDVLVTQGAEGEKRRRVEMDRVVEAIRKEVFNLVQKKSRPTYRRHDSVTSTARITIDDQWSTVQDDEEISSTLGKLRLRNM